MAIRWLCNAQYLLHVDLCSTLYWKENLILRRHYILCLQTAIDSLYSCTNKYRNVINRLKRSAAVIEVKNTLVAGFNSRIRRRTTSVKDFKHRFSMIKIPKATTLKIRRLEGISSDVDVEFIFLKNWYQSNVTFFKIWINHNIRTCCWPRKKEVQEKILVQLSI